MTKDIQKLTQNERYDLRKKQLREENLAYTIDILKNFEVLAKGMSIKDFKMKTNCDYIENQRLKAQLDREIKINRKMKKCLSAFARRDNWKAIEGCADWLFLLDPLMAEETLNEIDKEE